MFRTICAKLHWLLGITAGAVLTVMGVSGAALTFEEDIITALNGRVLRVTPAGTPMTPPQLAVIAQALRPDVPLRMLTVYVDPAAAARLMFAPQDPKARRGETVYIDPYRGIETGTEAQLRGHDILHVMEDLHRRLVSGDRGRALTGASTVALMVLALSGLYLRWPRRGASLRRWLTIDFSQKGRRFLWNLHGTAGTWVLLLYLLSGLTGLFFAYDWYRDAVYALAGETPRPRQNFNPSQTPGAAVVAPDLPRAWAAFAAEVNDWRQVSLNVAARPSASVEITYLAADAPHGRAVSRLVVSRAGAVQEHRRYAQQDAGAKLIASMFVLHSGQFFGRPGQIAMMLASAAMPLFFFSGWLLYLDRRRKRRMATRPRSAMPGNDAAGPPEGAAPTVSQ